MNDAKDGNSIEFPDAANEKAPVSQGKTGARILVHPAGFEPTTSGLGNRRPNPVTSYMSIDCNKSKASGTGKGTVSLDTQHFPETNSPSPELFADLAEIVALWPQLPDHVRVGIVAMIKAAVGKA